MEVKKVMRDTNTDLQNFAFLSSTMRVGGCCLYLNLQEPRKQRTSSWNANTEFFEAAYGMSSKELMV